MTQRGVLATLVIVGILVWPFIPNVPYDLLSTGVLACEYLIVALSLVLLIGLVGQISLAQAALVGMGAFVGAAATHRFGVRFPLTLLVGTAAGAVSASIVGVVALRVRGLYLAVATLIFAYVCDKYLFVQRWLVEAQSGTSIPFEVIGKKDTLPVFDLGDAHVFYFIALAVAVLVLYTVGNIRDSRLGRAFAAIRGSEVAAASLGINVVRVKLMGFALAGALAGLGGALLLVGQRTVAPAQFNFTSSLYFLAIAVVGGLRSLGGAIASALLFAVLVGEVFFHFPKLADYLDLISAALLIFVLLFFRGGLGALPARFSGVWARIEPQRRFVGQLFARLSSKPKTPDEKPSRVPAVVQRALAFATKLGQGLPFGSTPGSGAGPKDAPLDVLSLVERLTPAKPGPTEGQRTPTEPSASQRTEGMRKLLRAAQSEAAVAGEEALEGRRTPVLLSAQHITVKFGGLTAVSDASLQVGAGEIVGLIGPNGAGKTTLFNSILGLNQPTAGKVELYGKDVTKWGVHERAALGVGRTFQVLQLFGDLTVFENLLVATHLQNKTGLLGTLLVSARARWAERAARARVRAVLRLMELEQFADRQVGGLPFGVLRLVEVARTLVAGARLVCFDEPASGLDSTETERLIEWLQFLREIGVTLLVIEHDVAMVTRLCDFIYVLDQGQLIADGPPSEIQRDPAVIASYLGAPMEAA